MSLEKMQIVGGRPLRGEIEISGAKNATLPILAATVLTRQACRLRNVPNLVDIETMEKILRNLGVEIRKENDSVLAHAKELNGAEAPYDFVRKMRASVLLLGPLLARNGYARVALPGGCAIGVRPIDRHLRALEALGAEIHLADGYVEARATRLKGAPFTFDVPTVTGTMNAMFVATRAEGESVLNNCACEPEVIALSDVLVQMGASIRGAGTPTIYIKGSAELNGFDVEMIPDRIEAGTYLVAGAITGGALFVRGARESDLEAVLEKLRQSGARVDVDPAGIRIERTGPIRSIRLETSPHPGFPTDMQAQFVALLSLAQGTSEIAETIFENRFMHVAELSRMGAELQISGHTVKIVGVKKLHGAPVMATDLRASASLVLAGLAAEGETEVLRIYHLDRGYESMGQKLKAVGAEIRRVPV